MTDDDPGTDAAGEVRARRIVLEDGDGTERMVCEVVAGTAELRLDLPGRGRGRRTGVVVFAATGGGSQDGGDAGEAGGPGGRGGLGPAIGVQLWADGDAVAEVDAWPDDDGRWRAHLHVEGD